MEKYEKGKGKKKRGEKKKSIFFRQPESGSPI
jgi:hypothetical protein